MRRSDAKPPDVYNMGFRQACGRVAYGALNRRLSPAEAQRSPFHATPPLPRNIFPSTQRSPFHATLPLPRNIFPSTQRSHSTPRPRNAHSSPRTLKPLARPATPSRTCESLPDQGYEMGTCCHGTRALHLWAAASRPLDGKYTTTGLRHLPPSSHFLA